MGGVSHDTFHRLILDPKKQKKIRNRLKQQLKTLKKQRVDKPRQDFVKAAMKAGCPSEELANFLWKNRCTHYHHSGDVLVSGK